MRLSHILKRHITQPLKTFQNKLFDMGLDRSESKEEPEAANSKENTGELRYANERLRLEPEERKRIEERLEVADKIISTVDNFVFILNERDEITYGSPSVYRLLGYTPEDILRVGWQKLTRIEPSSPANEVEDYTPIVHLSNKDIGPARPYEWQIYDKQGNSHWILWQDTKGPDNSTVRIGYDITERKQAEAEILQRNRELTGLQAASFAITSSLDLRYVLDAVTYELTKIFGVDRCAISEWDQTKNTISAIAMYGPDRWRNDQPANKVCDLSRYPVTRSVLTDQIPEQMTIDQPHIDPAEQAYMRMASLKTLLLLPMVYQKRVVGLVELGDSRVERAFTHQEISLAKLLANQAANAIENAQLYKQAQQEIRERQQAEAALEEERTLLAQRVKERTAELSKANAELARAARLKDEFLASVSHELRTPLNAILGSSEILQSEVFGTLNERQLKYIRNAEESGRHLLALINDILDLSKIEAGKMDLVIAPILVKSVCEASLQLVKEMAHKKRLEVSHKLDEGITTISADERRLKQILVNLLSNAVKFTPEGGQVGLDVTLDRTQQIIQFTVWDNGIGISKEDMSRLFQPFVQVDSSLSRQYAGTGLGLSLVSRMAKMHGGGVSVESEVGKGSRFTVSFPCQETAKTDDVTKEAVLAVVNHPADKLEQTQEGGSSLILVAEDNENNITMLSDYLQLHGHKVIIARNGNEVIKLVKEEKPDIILMDIQMPEMDGIETIRYLRNDVQWSDIPIIAMTALAMPGDRERCLEAGANDYMSKPLSLIELGKRINIHKNNRTG